MTGVIYAFLRITYDIVRRNILIYRISRLNLIMRYWFNTIEMIHPYNAHKLIVLSTSGEPCFIIAVAQQHQIIIVLCCLFSSIQVTKQ